MGARLGVWSDLLYSKRDPMATRLSLGQILAICRRPAGRLPRFRLGPGSVVRPSGPFDRRTSGRTYAGGHPAGPSHRCQGTAQGNQTCPGRWI